MFTLRANINAINAASSSSSSCSFPRCRRNVFRRRVVVSAAAGEENESEVERDEEMDIAAIEARLKSSRKRVELSSSSSFSSEKTNEDDEKRFVWDLDPSWEEYGDLKKLWVAWSADKGILYWMNQVSLYAAGAIAFLWVFFRFVGPSLGLYELK